MSILLSLLCSFSSTFLMAVAGYLIAKSSEINEITPLYLAVVGVRFFGLSRGAFRYADRLYSHFLAFKKIKKIRLYLYKILEPLVPYKLHGISESRILSCVSADAEEYAYWMPRAGVPFFAGIISATVSICVLAYFNIYYALCFLVVSLLLFIISVVSFFLMKKYAKEWNISIEEFNEFSMSVANGMAEKKSWGIFEKIFADWEYYGLIEEKKRKKLYSLQLIAEIFSISAPFICIALMLFIGEKGLSFPIWIAILLGTLSAFELLQELPYIALQSALSINAKRRINNITQNKFNNIPNFKFTSSEHLIELNKGDALIVSGASGCGKTLLANSIAGFLPFDNVIQRTSNFIFLEQEPFLFTGTIKDNLLFAAPNATEEDMQRVLKKVNLNLHSDLWIGEKGFALSGGERQKLSAARAMLYSMLNKTDLIIADEPAAHLPLEEEKNMFKEFTNLPNNAAVLWFSHSTVVQ